MALLGRLGYNDEMRHELVYNLTDGRTHSTRQLTHVEREELCIRLHGMISQAEQTRDEAIRAKRSKVLTVATRLGLKQPDSWDKFNAWMQKSSVHKKNLYRYTMRELNDLLRQLHSMEYRNKKSAANPGTKAWYSRFGVKPSDN